jgi:hypothetical protein
MPAATALARHDDQADALGLVGQLLDLMVTGSKPAPPEKREVDDGYKDALGEALPGSAIACDRMPPCSPTIRVPRPDGPP